MTDGLFRKSIKSNQDTVDDTKMRPINTVCRQAGIIDVIIYLHEKGSSNQKTLLDNTIANTTTIASIKYLLLTYNLITIKKGELHNQSIYELTEKGNRLAHRLIQINNDL